MTDKWAVFNSGQNVPGRENSTCKEPEKLRSVCGTLVTHYNWNIAWVGAYAVTLERPDSEGPAKDSRATERFQTSLLFRLQRSFRLRVASSLEEAMLVEEPLRRPFGTCNEMVAD